jgi:hypothetical protein
MQLTLERTKKYLTTGSRQNSEKYTNFLRSEARAF